MLNRPKWVTQQEKSIWNCNVRIKLKYFESEQDKVLFSDFTDFEQTEQQKSLYFSLQPLLSLQILKTLYNQLKKTWILINQGKK